MHDEGGIYPARIKCENDKDIFLSYQLHKEINKYFIVCTKWVIFMKMYFCDLFQFVREFNALVFHRMKSISA